LNNLPCFFFNLRSFHLGILIGFICLTITAKT
jgi:hypothetical protein